MNIHALGTGTLAPKLAGRDYLDRARGDRARQEAARALRLDESALVARFFGSPQLLGLVHIFWVDKS